MLDGFGKFVITNKQWKDAFNALPEQERIDKIYKMASQFAVKEGERFVEALVKSLEEKDE